MRPRQPAFSLAQALYWSQYAHPASAFSLSVVLRHVVLERPTFCIPSGTQNSAVTQWHMSKPLTVLYLHFHIRIMCLSRRLTVDTHNPLQVPIMRVVTKISSCQANTKSRRRIKQLGVSFLSIFLLFSFESSQPLLLVTALYNPLQARIQFLVVCE